MTELISPQIIYDMSKILIVDDDPDILEFLGYNFELEGFKVFKASDGKEAIIKAKDILPDLIIMDVMMPHMDGIETTTELRKIPEIKNTIIIFLTARGEDYSQLAGYEAGADDYITKPVKPKILISKVNALLRRSNSHIKADSKNKDKADVKGLFIDHEKYVVVKDGKSLYLPRKEFELLSLLVSRPGKVFLRDEIYNRVWGNETVVGDRTIDVHIRKLRAKVGDNLIKTIKGVGYRYDEI
jgi:two-component system, OmpR family, alkaline phosphatase synthesis response regulator PhoP